MPRVFDHYPTSLPLNPLHYDFFTVLRAASPVVTFHCPSPLTQRSFSFVYSISFTRGLDSKPLLVAEPHPLGLISFSTFPNTVSLPSYPLSIPSLVTPTAIPHSS